MQLFSMSYLFMFNWATDVLILTGLFDIEDRIGACIIFYVIVLIMPLQNKKKGEPLTNFSPLFVDI